MANTNMSKSAEGKELLSKGAQGGVKFITGDGRLGWPQDGPYDVIHVGAAAATLHEELVGQLKAPGRMFIPVETGGSQYIWVVDKKEDGTVDRKKEFGVSYVPLCDAPVKT
jgi:protein-L-isoaspartate(D-aspartate) O-methyltransferase